MRRDGALLLDMLVAAHKITRFLQGLTELDFQTNEMVQSAVIRELQVIGEAARLISAETKARHSGVDWHAITGMRNRIIHEYFDIRLDVVWKTAAENIPPLIAALERIIPPEI